jgi:anaerobic selenocysteine-containing dehydrogenase
VIQGKAIKIEGNPLHPINQGRLCPKGQSGLHALYDPDRIRSPLRRAGERGAGKWEEIGWEEAIGQVSENLKELRREDMAHSLVVMSGQKRGVGSELLEGFTKAFGSPNFIPDDSDYSSFSPSVFLMQGIESRPCYDLFNANYVLSFNSSILETSWSPVQAMRAYGSLRERRLLKRSKLVHAGPYLSLTAAKADEWIPIAPGTEAALALSMCHVIIREGLLDDRFVSKYAFGFDDWRDQEGGRHIGFRTLVLRDYGPGDVSELTGVPTQTIIRLAKEFSLAKPSLAVDQDRAVAQSQNTYAKMAIHALNALSGNIDHPGGVLAPTRPASFHLPIPQPAGPIAPKDHKRGSVPGEVSFSTPLQPSVLLGQFISVLGSL